MHASFRGNILPLALVIMASILLAGIGLGITVMNSIRRSADIDASMVAYYAADAGLERQLYELRKNAAAVEDLEELSDALSNGSDWVAASSTFLQTNIKMFAETPSTSLQIVDLFDPDNISAAAGVGRVDWSWEAGDDCAGGVAPDIELGYAQWLSGGTVLPDTFAIVQGLSPSGMVTLLDPTKGYRLRFHPKECTAANLTIEASPSSSYAPMEFPGDITLGAIGTFRRSTQSITVRMPRQDVLSGVFSYVIFAECELVKDPDGGSTCP